MKHMPTLCGYRTSALGRKANHLCVAVTWLAALLLNDIFLTMWRVRAYTLREKINIWRGKIWSRPFFWEALLRDDLTARLTRFELPVYFLVGRHDFAANADLSRAYFDAIEAPVTGFHLFDDSAHSPLFEEPERARQILLQDVLRGQAERADP